ncbi:MAG: hypothetical protein ACREVW_02955 [Burkholderiales bacterium]
MTPGRHCVIWLAALALACGGPAGTGRQYPTTVASVAIANLDHQIARLRDDAGVEDLLLVRSRFLGDYEALDRAVSLARQAVGYSPCVRLLQSLTQLGGVQHDHRCTFGYLQHQP